MDTSLPSEQRRFALEVVRRLRQAGFEAYWAGGCVRDQLLGRTPKDYDVATNAVPQQVRDVFGRRRTLAIGAAFGVIAVIGPRTAGLVEVTTFRQDSPYSDGRHPDSVTFGSAKEDAQRRDFTINGMFFDPVDERVLDFVGGQKDLAERRLRAIGSARERFDEDKLRMLRAVRFAAAFDLALDDGARAAIVEMAHAIHVVSAERIAMEMRRMLVDANRAAGVRLLVETGLAAEVLPEIVRGRQGDDALLERAIESLSRLRPECCFSVALATLLEPFSDAIGVAEVCHRWRLSNKESERTCWLVENRAALLNARTMQWSALQPLLISDGIEDLLALTEVVEPNDVDVVAYCRDLLRQPIDLLNPPPLVTGNDLLARGIPAGPCFKAILNRIRAAQLDGEIESKGQAIDMAMEVASHADENRRRMDEPEEEDTSKASS